MKNVLSIFERRVNDIFSQGGGGSEPIAFKRLAKKTLREMENETFVIDGIDTAPALYTILVSADDDRAMRPLYISLTAELSSLIEAQAKKRGYSLVGKPLVRFMIDPSLKTGKYAVFAENIDPRTLARLRDEENAFLGVDPASAPAYQAQAPTSQPAPAPAPAAPANERAEADPDLFSAEASLAKPEPASPAPQPEQPEPQVPSEQQAAVQPAPEEEPAAAFDPEPVSAPAAQEENAPASPEPEETPSAAHFQPRQEPQAEDGDATVVASAQSSCTLTDQQTGKVYTITSQRTPIGRERVEGGIVLRDPNVSRRHAELTYDGRDWHITDLGSTNGTLVNDIDVEDCSLRDGDIITIGLLNFVFREG